MHCDTFLQQVLFPMAHKLALITFKYTGKSMACGDNVPIRIPCDGEKFDCKVQVR